MKTMKLHTKNMVTGEHEVITQYDVQVVGWGIDFKVDTEMEAFKAAYLYRKSKGEVRVEYAPNIGQWLVTVFNEGAAELY